MKILLLLIIFVIGCGKEVKDSSLEMISCEEKDQLWPKKQLPNWLRMDDTVNDKPVMETHRFIKCHVKIVAQSDSSLSDIQYQLNDCNGNNIADYNSSSVLKSWDRNSSQVEHPWNSEDIKTCPSFLEASAEVECDLIFKSVCLGEVQMRYKYMTYR
ncbi:MAG: hypothetical protein WCK49_00290 [Myxococcaceae bacterium]